ncbi:MAG: hypothetical protein COV46_00300 [Deltaproteobacteria bacterium CG11_big_fil_rev_8_21_14_0_20_49_13]|nr:MAG: hypothetical protein COV46_00300 [Deltaproteobacteria bacterium CG11_big_fil_rev_8_21_14_0_20_49_13]
MADEKKPGAIGGQKDASSADRTEADRSLFSTVDQTRAGQTQKGAGGDTRLSDSGFLRVPPRLNQILQAFQSRAEGAMQAFRLPGSNKVVHDNREQTGKGDAKDAKGRDDKHIHREGVRDKSEKNIRIREGKAEEVKEKTYENYLAIRQMVANEKMPEAKSKERQLSDFEKLLIERFEKSKKIEEAGKEGKTSFLAKTVEQWRSFFDKFMHRTAKKSAELTDIQQFLYRGMVKKGDAKAVMISDIIHNSGQTEKFARFGVLYQKLGGLLSKLVPGDSLSAKSIKDGIESERLWYLSILPPDIGSEIITGRKPKQGMFGSEAVEAMVAKELGIAYDKGTPSGQHRGEFTKQRKRRGGGMFAGLFGGDEELPVEQQGQFVPWWQWGTLKRPGGFTLKRALYSGVIILLIMVIFLVIDRLLK